MKISGKAKGSLEKKASEKNHIMGKKKMENMNGKIQIKQNK